MMEGKSWGSRLFDVFNHILLVALGLMCLLPLVNVLARSLSDRAATTAHLVKFWPINFTTMNYRQILLSGQFQRSFAISVVRVGLGSAISLAITALTAYPLSLRKSFAGQGIFKWVLIFAMLFGGGLIPWFLAIRSLGLLDKIWALVLPPAVQMFHIIVMLNFFRTLPVELSEAATIDGASHWHILFQIFLPLSKAGLATILLFVAVQHWNSWFDGLILMSRPANYPLQTYMYVMTTSVRARIDMVRDPEVLRKLSQQSLRAAQVFMATVPILVVYPFLQRYFVKGLVLGAIKG